uniref:Ion_trans domain-containing protein n=1 Tax=Macrostomum lignano TaxID=282301 RepID=A0A1I8FH76_9PLAT
NVLREEVKEKLKWNVDRNSSSTKIRDFMDWTKAILNDIHYQKKVLSNLSDHRPHPAVADLEPLCTLAPPGGANTPSLDISADESAPVPDAFFKLADGPSPTSLTPCPSSSCWPSSLPIIEAARPGQAGLAAPAVAAEGPGRERTSCASPVVRTSCPCACSPSPPFTTSCLSAARLRGTFYSPYFFAFHLLNIVNNNQMLRGVIQASPPMAWSLLVVWGPRCWAYPPINVPVRGDRLRQVPNRPSVTRRHELLMFCGRYTLPASCFVHASCRFVRLNWRDLILCAITSTANRNFDEYVWMALFSITFFVLISSTIGLNIINLASLWILSVSSETRKWMAETDMPATAASFCSRKTTMTSSTTRKGLNSFRSTEPSACRLRTRIQLTQKLTELLSNVKDLVQHQKEERPPAAKTPPRHWRRPAKAAGGAASDSRAAPARRTGVSCSACLARRHEEEDEDELPRSPSLPGSEEDYRLSGVPETNFFIDKNLFYQRVSLPVRKRNQLMS